MPHYDVVVSGAGLVGSTFSAVLAKRCPKLSQLLIDARTGQCKLDDSIPFSADCIAWNGASENLFKEIGLWPNLLQRRIQSVKSMKVWDACSPAMTCLHRNDGKPTAHIVQNNIALCCLHEHLGRLPSVKQRFGASIQELGKSDRNWLKLNIKDDQQVVDCKLLVVAEGVESALREKVGISSRRIGYDCWATVVVMKAKSSDPFAAYQRFLPTGPVASLPITNDTCCVILFTSKKEASRISTLSDAELVSTVNRMFSDMTSQNVFSSTIDKTVSWLFDLVKSAVGTELLSDRSGFPPPVYESVLIGTRRSYPIRTVLANQFVKFRTALVGDSAHRIHPLAGQGANVGLADVEALVNIIEEQHETGQDIGDALPLLKYERRRQPVAVSKALMMDAFYRLFSTSFWPVVVARSLGFSAFDRLQPAKDFALLIANNG